LSETERLKELTNFIWLPILLVLGSFVNSKLKLGPGAGIGISGGAELGGSRDNDIESPSYSGISVALNAQYASIKSRRDGILP
jgi:hypothetical protein